MDAEHDAPFSGGVGNSAASSVGAPVATPLAISADGLVVPGVPQALFVEFCLATGKMSITEAIKHAQETEKFRDNRSFMDWLMRPGTNIWTQRERAFQI